MARNIPSAITTEAAKQVTTPVYLIELYFSGVNQTIRVSSRQQVTVDSTTVFSQTNPHVKVASVTPERATISVPNPTSIMLYNTLNSSANKGESYVKIWAMYGESTTVSSSDTVLMFDGTIDEVPKIHKNEIQYACVAGNLPTMWTPRILIGPPLCNHLPVDGTIIGNITLERK